MDNQGFLDLLQLFIIVPFLIIAIVGNWATYEKAGKPGWATLIPFYNIYILLKIVGRPGWWLILYFVPIINFVIQIVVALDLARVFEKAEFLDFS